MPISCSGWQLFARHPVIDQLYRAENNRFSYQFTDLAEIDGRVAGFCFLIPDAIWSFLRSLWPGSFVDFMAFLI
jgi:hypothetical protein